MKAVGFLLLLAGWFLVLAALDMLRAPGALAGFVIAGFACALAGLREPAFGQPPTEDRE